jgi:uncharacterized lipoprotein YddW (UPF0748 family)
MRLKRCQLLCFLVLVSCIQINAAEIRSLWVTPWSLTSPAQIDDVINDALSNNQNEILAEVRYRADALYIPNKFNSQFNNPEPRSNILPDNDFDPLGYLLDKAHENGIYVQAWISVLCATQTSWDLLRSNYIYVNHPDWILTDTYGRKMNGRNYMGNFIDPGILEARSHLVNVMLDIVANYPALDGIHLDYIRYPAIQFGHSSESLNRYRTTIQDTAMTWNDWRILQVTDLIREFRGKALQLNPRLLITAAVFADTYEAKVHLAQDWIQWLQDGIIDRAYPMAYSKRNNNFQRVVENIAESTDKSKVVIGLRAWQEYYPRVDYKVEQVIDKARLCREMGFAGLALFSYDGIKKSGFFPELTNAIFDPLEPDDAFNPEEDFLTKITGGTYDGNYPDTLDIHVSDTATTNVKILEDINKSNYSEQSKSYFDSIEFQGAKYLVTFYLESEGIWEWDILDENATIVYKTQKVYPKGYYTEEWSGLNSENKPISPGVYTLRLSNVGNVLVDRKKLLIY